MGVGPGIKMQKVHRYRVLKGNLDDDNSKPTSSNKKPLMIAGPPQGSPVVSASATAAKPAVSNEAESNNEDEDAILKEETKQVKPKEKKIRKTPGVKANVKAVKPSVAKPAGARLLKKRKNRRARKANFD